MDTGTTTVKPTFGVTYIPPNGFYFRLGNYNSKYWMFSRIHAEPQVFHTPENTIPYDDQYFTLIHGTGNRQGLYCFRGFATKKVLFSRLRTEPYVWHVDGNGNYNDKYVVSCCPGRS
jgi:hypothetical protein